MHRSGHYVELPMIDKQWLRRWKRDYGVSYRRPNQRYKCSRRVLGDRLRTMWLNCIRVRRAAQRLLGHDLQYAIYGIDETPFHMNECGSKAVGTLEIQGAPVVRLKENHAATRQRVSVMTTVTSCRAVALQPRQLPIEVCVAGTSRKLKNVAIPKGVNMTIIASPKGSYRTEHIFQFLDTWLDPWTEERAKRQDWRMFFFDVAKSHLADELERLLWSRGYIRMIHFGHTTGVAQVNDTDLHGPLERIYQYYEAEAFFEQQTIRPGDIGRSLQQAMLGRGSNNVGGVAYVV